MTPKRELHYTGRTGWLRAAVLGANDGIVSTASLVIGVAAARATHGNIMIAGVAGLVAGAMSMAAGEYVSVSTQADTEQADIDRERRELEADDTFERGELAAIYVRRGLEPSLARTVADQLMAHDALGAHARDELGISEMLKARPIQAALASAGDVRGRRRTAARRGGPGPADGAHSMGGGDRPAVPGADGRARLPRRRRAGVGRSGSRGVLGRAGDGADRRRGHPVRNIGVRPTSSLLAVRAHAFLHLL